eukprot:TRINITY_DN28414_c0_g1_i1.p1 TRINITY_DN28414_c0_g1~~TRINITY_DN28414_c0_g1_i1.p1  ORF type:complete len:125 (-),score=29.98 TRINITY_DN28414_c0_g1_i1:144-470(-)
MEDILSRKLTEKLKERTREEDSMYGDGDSETESDSNTTNNNYEQEEVDVLEVFIEKGETRVSDKDKKKERNDDQYNKVEINTSTEAKGRKLNTIMKMTNVIMRLRIFS